MSVSGQGSYTWAASTSDTRALLKAASTTDRLASCWYSGTNFTIDVNLTDGNAHRLALYTIDWDASDARQERIEVLDASTNAVLDTRDVSSYSSGKYLVWNLRGHVKLKFTHLSPAGYSAVVSGLFFDSDPARGANINWLVTDQLGTPRMIFDKSGSLATTKRHDYAPFGEELFNGLRPNVISYAADSTARSSPQKNTTTTRLSKAHPPAEYLKRCRASALPNFCSGAVCFASLCEHFALFAVRQFLTQRTLRICKEAQSEEVAYQTASVPEFQPA